MTTPTPDDVAVGLKALDEERRKQADLDLVNDYRKAVDFLRGLRTCGVPEGDVIDAVTNVDSLFCMAVQRST
ncbi:hypothetical protein QFZ75_007945 [Streptomyces sp. V3I8]|uniref:hypothetical protein n=1 Tax=Streptomyces sp. V3I8 TaxID=3042279 RepID=UPI002789FE77|nr:hypothetical protein [Streptomyces sp. V3I8]MDQ1041443.1 hypothetical protein [Streptomyces sp. V3I8]